jgi:hypothetical protein
VRTLPIDTTAITFLASAPPAPVLDFQTKQPKADSNGEPLYAVQLVAMQPAGADVITVKVPGQPTIAVGAPVRVVGLIGLPWENNGRSGVAFRATRIEAVSQSGIASRRVVGFALAEHLRTELVADALTNAVAARDPAPGLVFHADRGCQYTSGAYATLAADLTVTLSTGRTGQCWDNALAESFFASLKGECLDLQPWPTRAAARWATVEYIAWYNGTRLHSALGYQTPDEFETTSRQEALTQVA